MQKSIKKVIAGAIAALMITSSMPIVASAAVGDYEPDVHLQFSSFFDADEQTDPTEKSASSSTCYQSSGLKAFPIQYDEETGTLTAKADDMTTYNTYWESDPAESDIVLGEGDLFAVTIRFDNVGIAASGNVNIRYSDNISPAGICSYKSGKKTYFTFASEDSLPAGFQAEMAGFRSPIKEFSASTLYEGMNDTVLGDLSCIQEDPNAVEDDGWSDDMMTATLVCSGDYVDVSSVDSSNGFFDIKNGTYDDEDGYTYDNQFVVATFVFAITDDSKPVQFTLQDPTGEFDSELNNAVFFGKKSEGLAKENGTTYAPNGENPGSMKMTFMGKNENKGGETPHEHSYSAVVTNPTCEAGGYTTYTCECGDTYEADFTDALGHNLGDWTVSEAAVAATCTTAGKTAVETRSCSRCEYSETRGGDVVPATGHTEVVDEAVEATCTATGLTAGSHCSVCQEVIVPQTVVPAKGHTPGDPFIENEVAPTKKDKGSYDTVTICTVCKEELSRETTYTDALGVTVTLTKTDIGIVEGLEVGANKLAYGADINLTATPVGTAKFVGWEIGGNIVSKEATYSTKAVSDITITPVFEDAAAETITVTFFDKYGNTVKQYKNMEVADYQAAIAAPTYPSYTFESWDKTKDEILALDASTTIWANYKKVEEDQIAKYTVITNAEVVLPAGIVNGEIPYDTQVTVKDETAAAWKIGETIVAYGTSYTFYVGSDVAIDPVFEVAEEKASTVVIGANLLAGSDYKFNIVATRNVPDSFTLVDYGFVYGKDLTDAELDLDKVGTVAASGATIKAVHAGTRNTESNEFAFNYGIKAKNAPVTAKSFVVAEKDGETEIIYSDMFTQNY